MSEFLIYFQIGLKHVLDIHAYDHVLFLIALVVPFSFKDWKRIILLITLFTIGHTLALLLSVFGIIAVKANVVELLIPIPILLPAFFNLFTAGKSNKKESIKATHYDGCAEFTMVSRLSIRNRNNCSSEITQRAYFLLNFEQKITVELLFTRSQQFSVV